MAADEEAVPDRKVARYSLSHVRTHFSEMVRRAEAGEEIEITKRGKLRARMEVSPNRKAR